MDKKSHTSLIEKIRLNFGASDKVSADVSIVTNYLTVFLTLGLSFVIVETRAGNPFTALLWALACFGVGALIGFLFGIPRVLQDGPTSPSAPPAAGGVGPPANGASPYDLRVNTNLEQISDWLTKIIVGLGLVQLAKAPGHLSHASDFIAFGLGTGTKIFAGGIIVYFSILGFMGGYLITRLYIAGAFSRADQDARQINRDLNTIARIDVSTSGETQNLTQEGEKAVKNLVGKSPDELKSVAEKAGWAKAQLASSNYYQAIKTYAELIQLYPDDVKLRQEYATALFYQGSRETGIYQLLEAKKRITPTTNPSVRSSVFISLTFQYLYVLPPDGFAETIKHGEEYTSDPANIDERSIWINLACAYGQQMAWQNSQEDVGPETKEETRQKALSAVKRAAGFGETAKAQLRGLMRPSASPEGDDDLVVFKEDPKFREVVGLPPNITTRH
jgi:hypothetical protein